MKEGVVSFRSVFYMAGLGIFAAVVTFVAAPLASGGDARVEGGIEIASGTLALSGLATLGSEILQLERKFLAWNLLRSCNLSLPSVAIIVLFFLDKLSFQSAFFATYVGTALWAVAGTIVAIVSSRKLLASRRPAWGFSLRIWFTRLFDFVGMRVDQVLLAALATTSQLGTYAVAATCASASGALTQALGHVVFPDQAAASADAQSRNGRVFLVGIGSSIASSAAMLLVIAVFGDILFGPTFDGLLPTAALLMVFQLLSDQWNLVVYRDSAGMSAGQLAGSSLVGLLTLCVSLVAVNMFWDINGISMAACMIAFGAARLISRFASGLAHVGNPA
ncbi:oligosaccharide flippase family protein [Rhodococcus pyridinivorans]|uniref:oligosaccharide flippase family protein n=1 Tax=Rhodococcus pyridinivorans TaxID=103816 RepID=UPI0021647D9B|nr:oligosaccharide flippase family protein [Rhodococcus pyridinivorans]UVT24121.1 oligosaccharide flippase family protein [Rhodococcus pyridinivorans]